MRVHLAACCWMPARLYAKATTMPCHALFIA